MIYLKSNGGNDVFVWLHRSVSSVLMSRLCVQTLLLEAAAQPDQADHIETELAAMAADPDIQRENGCINAEFAQTEADGLTDHDSAPLPEPDTYQDGFQPAHEGTGHHSNCPIKQHLPLENSN